MKSGFGRFQCYDASMLLLLHFFGFTFDYLFVTLKESHNYLVDITIAFENFIT